jgi:AAA domain
VQTALHCNIWTELAADPWLTADAWYAVQDAGLMALHIVTADERLAEANSKTTVAIFAQPGIGKTSLLWTLLASTALCIDLEAGMKSVEDWPGDSIPIGTWLDAVDIACLIGGLDPDDNTGEAKTKRRLRGLADLDGITFVAKIAVEPNNDPRSPDKNKLDRPVLPNEKEWRAVMNGEDVAPSPSRPRSGANASRNAPGGEARVGAAASGSCAAGGCGRLAAARDGGFGAGCRRQPAGKAGRACLAEPVTGGPGWLRRDARGVHRLRCRSRCPALGGRTLSGRTSGPARSAVARPRTPPWRRRACG